MILRTVQVSGKELQCERCLWEWISIASELPEACPNRECRSRQWNGPKKRGRKTKIELPKPKVTRWMEGDSEF